MNSVSLPSGFTARNATLDDVDIAVELFKIYASTTAGVEDVNAEEARNLWQSPMFDPATDIHLVFSEAGQLVAYVETWVNSEVPVNPFVWACVHPDFTGQGLMQTTGLDRFFRIKTANLTETPAETPASPQPDLSGTSDAAAKNQGRPVWEWWNYRDDRPHAPAE